ncbi:MAG: radical SAM protein [Lentisphaerae bacterium GWF2_44_16]|nr:MAG: radical SAM protein [Lentisphaerae bacterium GWF2_44_16]
MNHIFGPVPSRRLGRSLGVDLVPFKTCTYDCIYCQLGKTTCKTMRRQEWVSLDEVLKELKENLASNPDYITLSGSGEPTLYSRIDELITGIRSMTDIPIAVLTNGSLLWQKEVRSQLLKADLIIPSLDAGDKVLFEAVNRPHPEISFESMLDGLKSLRDEFQGQYWLEVLITGGYTAINSELEKIAALVAKIMPDRVQLNTVTRPPAEDFAMGISRERLEEFAGLFDPRAEVIADFRGIHSAPDFSAARESVLELLRRRPCSIDDIANGLGIHRNEAVKYAEELLAAKSIERTISNGKTFFRING